MHSLKNFCNFLPNVIDGHIGSEDIADLFSSMYEQLYNFVGFYENNMHLLKVELTVLLLICVCMKIIIITMVTTGISRMVLILMILRNV